MSPESTLSLRVLTPEGAILEANGLTSVRVPLVVVGSIGIRSNHAPLIAETQQGHVVYRTDSEENRIHLHPGVLNIRDNLITILTAGVIDKTPAELSTITQKQSDRLMYTLVRKLQADQDYQEILDE